MKIIVFSCGFNCGKYVENHIKSIENQTYDNYLHILVDDGSTDNTYELLCKNRTNNTIIHSNIENKKWILNAKQYLSISDDDIVVVVDMDDWLANKNVFSNIVDVYEKTDCWLTYSKFFYMSKKTTSDWIPQYTNEILNNSLFRESIWSFTHLRTFKGFLWKKINDNDLKDKNNEYFKYAYDQAIFLPMLEMSAPNKIQFINELQYIYNDSNPINVHKTNKKDQENTAKYIRSLPKYKRIINE